MKKVSVLVVMSVCVALGLYAGILWAITSGLWEVFRELSAPPVIDSRNLFIGIAKVLSAIAVGLLVVAWVLSRPNV